MAEIAYPPSGFVPTIFLTSDRPGALPEKMVDTIWEQWIAVYLVVLPITVAQIQGRA